MTDIYVFFPMNLRKNALIQICQETEKLISYELIFERLAPLRR